jgi:tetratricopeptide (TPR) repeat protein
MARIPLSVLAFLVLISSVSFAQIEKITIPAGSPPDNDLNTIGKEQDTQKKISMYQEFLQKYASDPMAIAYGNWQLSESYLAAGDLQKAIEAGDKAVALSPRNLDILTSQILIAQKLNDNARIFRYSIQGGEAYDSIDKQTKPANMSDQEFQSNITADKEANKNTYEFFQRAAINAIAAESDAKTRMDEVERFTATFPKSGMDEQLASFAMLSLSELKDTPRLIAYAEKALEANPNNLPALLLLANTYAESPGTGNLPKAISYAERAIAAAKGESPAAEKSKKISAGVAHSVLGRVYAKQEKTIASINELKSATALLKGEDEQQFAQAAYFLGWDYAKLNRLTEARAILTEAIAVPGPVQGPARELLTKVNSARAAGR